MPYSYLCVTGYVSALSNSLEEDIINSLIPSGGVLLPRRLVAKGVVRIYMIAIQSYFMSNCYTTWNRPAAVIELVN